MSGLKLTPGTVIRIRGMHELGDPEEVKVSSGIAQRCKWIREQVEGTKLCDVFQDPKTGEVYIDPDGKELPREQEGDRRSGKVRGPDARPGGDRTGAGRPVRRRSRGGGAGEHGEGDQESRAAVAAKRSRPEYRESTSPERGTRKGRRHSYPTLI